MIKKRNSYAVDALFERNYEMRKKAPSELSEEYYQFVETFTQTDFEDEKILGKFYTNHDIATSMMRLISQFYVRDNDSSDIHVIDPFCGDGRLIVSLLSELLKARKLTSARLFISAWDIDKDAIAMAKREIAQFCETHDLKYEIDVRKTDAFVSFDAVRGKYDICVTNPPWSLLKPQKLFSKNNDEKALIGYRNAIEHYDSYMKEAF